MVNTVFTYGTLQVPAVMSAVTGKDFPSQTAVLTGYRRCRIKNRVYPAIIKDASASTSGTLYLDVDDDSLQLLDQFEDILYDRLKVEVIVKKKSIPAYAYVIANKYQQRLEDREWDLEEFIEKNLPSYLRRIFA